MLDGLDADCDFLADGIVLTATAACGRSLFTAREFSPREKLLVAPAEIQIHPPPTAAGVECDESKVSSLAATYAEVVRLCDSVSSTFGARMYWAALSSLVVTDGPLLVDDHLFGSPCTEKVSGSGPIISNWVLPPPVSEDVQVRLLKLYHPTMISSKNPGLMHDGQDAAASRVVETFQLKCSPTKFAELVLILKYNTFTSLDGGGLDLFFVPSLCNHSCSPNCGWARDEEGRFCLYAGHKGLAKGSGVSISYMNDEDLECTTQERREMLAGNWSFFCQCERCVSEEIPPCGDCGQQTSVLLSLVDESPYGNYDVDCDTCQQQDLQLKHSFFFHCFQCGRDICPNCAPCA